MHISVFRIKKGEKELNFFEGRAIIIVTVTFSKFGVENFLLLILCTIGIGRKNQKTARYIKKSMNSKIKEFRSVFSFIFSHEEALLGACSSFRDMNTRILFDFLVKK